MEQAAAKSRCGRFGVKQNERRRKDDAICAIFRQKTDRMGASLTWSNPSDKALNDQGAIDMFCRIQITPEIAISPTLQFIIDPVRNPDEDEIFVLGIRTRFEV